MNMLSYALAKPTAVARKNVWHDRTVQYTKSGYEYTMRVFDMIDTTARKIDGVSCIDLRYIIVIRRNAKWSLRAQRLEVRFVIVLILDR